MTTEDTLRELSDAFPKEWRSVVPEWNSTISNIQRKINFDNCNPSPERIFSALSLPPESVKVLILGQDPYPTKGDATGLAFSVDAGRRIPPSLRNILTEYSTDLGWDAPDSGDLTSWQRHGVLLLNTILSCQPGRPLSHAEYGWQSITGAIVQYLSRQSVVAISWGKSAQELTRIFPSEQRIESPHPSPLSAYRGFLGSKPFSRANVALINLGVEEVNWRLPHS